MGVDVLAEYRQKGKKMDKKKYTTILFDLDGTLTDSGTGIMHAFEYAIHEMGGVVSDKSLLKRFVGPPLEDSFEHELGYSAEDTKKAIVHYREYYFGKGGAMENDVYPGIEEMLVKLKKAGKQLAVATSKNERGTKLVLEHFGLDKYFDVVAASNDEDRRTKADVIRYALSLCHCNNHDVIMVGDRYHDIDGANDVGIDSIGVLWGYGDRKELENAGASFIIEKPADILKVFE